MSWTLVVEIPALERLCNLLEDRTIDTLANYFRAEAKEQLAAEQDAAAKPEPKPEPRPEPKPEPRPEPKPAPEPETVRPVTLDAVQRAAAELRDAGKLKAVTDLFPAFQIKKLSDLKGDALTAFAAELRGLGATI